MIKQCLQDQQADLFLSFEDDLEKIQINYEENKSSPPVSLRFWNCISQNM